MLDTTRDRIAFSIGSLNDHVALRATLAEIRELPEINIRRASSPRLSYAIAVRS